MKPFLATRKALALLSCAALATLAIGATFAWTSLRSQKVNEWRGTGSAQGPGGSMHDDHDNSKGDDPKKDVYVENWGDKPILVRIKLSEYMEIGKEAGAIDTDTDTKELFRKAENESIPLADNGLIQKNGKDYLNFTIHAPDASVEDCGNGFHEYWKWILGNSTESAQKIYKPASDSQKAAASQENGSVVSDDQDYSELTDGLKRTLDGRVITMAEFLALDENDTSNYWAYDEDGWAYWTNMLRPGSATSMLIHRVEKTDKKIEDKYFYAINVRAEMADLTEPFKSSVSSTEPESDFTDWITGNKGTEVASASAQLLLRNIYKDAVAEGLFGDAEITEEQLDIIFNP